MMPILHHYLVMGQLPLYSLNLMLTKGMYDRLSLMIYTKSYFISNLSRKMLTKIHNLFQLNILFPQVQWIQLAKNGKSTIT